MSRFAKLFAATTSAILMIGGLSACSAGAGEDTVKIGVVGASDPAWEIYERAARDAGIPVEIVDFGEYTQPNPAVTAGDVDINQFQHLVYLAKYNVDSGTDLQPIGSTAIYPLGLYSKEYGSVEGIPQGAKIGVPNDTTNQARGLLVLQSAGLITLRGGGDAFSTTDDIDPAASRVEVVTIDADKMGQSLPDLAGAIINNDFIEQAGFQASDAIAQDEPADASARPYVNVFATTADKKDDPRYQQLVEIYQNTQEVLDAVQDKSGGTAEFTIVPPAELQETLATVEADYRSASGK